LTLIENAEPTPEMAGPYATRKSAKKEGSMLEDRVTQNQKIQVLLAEYSGVRSHIVARTTASIQGVAIFIASLAILAPQFEIHPVTSSILLVILAPILAVVAKFIHSDLYNEVEHVQRLEAEINRRAGEPLLTYETTYGIAVTGVWKRLRRTR
jgi:hypothetical protein